MRSPPRLGATETITIPEAQRARSAAYVITTTEGAALHLERLRTRPDDFDADVRDRLIAGALVPAAAVVQAQKFRRWFREEMLRLFQRVDAILAPATPCVAPLIGQKTFVLDGKEMPVAPQYRHLHPADLLHRPAGRGGSRADSARACRSACRSLPHRGARISRCGSPGCWKSRGAARAPLPALEA